MITQEHRFAVYLKVQYEDSKRLLKNGPQNKKDNASIFGVTKNSSSYYPDSNQVHIIIPRSVLPRQFFFYIFVIIWLSRNQAGYHFNDIVEKYYCHSLGIITDFLLPEQLAIELGFMKPFGTEKRKEYIKHILEMSSWKSSVRTNPISKRDALNLSLEVIDYESSKNKKPKEPKQAKVKLFVKDPYSTINESTGRRINRNKSPTVVIHLFISIPDNITETSLYFSFVTNVIKAINNWFITHSNIFYEEYFFTLQIRLIFDPKRPSQSVDSNNPFVRTNNYLYIQNKLNYTLMNKLKDFEDTVWRNIEYIKHVNVNDVNMSYLKLDDLLQTYIREVVPYLDRTPSLISLLPFPSDRTLPFYNELFSQGLKEISLRVRKPSTVTLSSIKLFSIRAPFDNSLMPPVFRIGQAGNDATYNRNLFLFLTEKEFYDLVNSIKNKSAKVSPTKEKPNAVTVNFPKDNKG